MSPPLDVDRHAVHVYHGLRTGCQVHHPEGLVVTAVREAEGRPVMGRSFTLYRSGGHSSKQTPEALSRDIDINGRPN